MAVFPSAVQKSCVLAKHFLSITELFHGDYRLVFSGNYICLSFIYICVCVCVCILRLWFYFLGFQNHSGP